MKYALIYSPTSDTDSEIPMAILAYDFSKPCDMYFPDGMLEKGTLKFVEISRPEYETYTEMQLFHPIKVKYPGRIKRWLRGDTGDRYQKVVDYFLVGILCGLLISIIVSCLGGSGISLAQKIIIVSLGALSLIVFVIRLVAICYRQHILRKNRERVLFVP